MDMAYVAMFDEVDEGTAIFKVTNAPLMLGRFATFDGLPSDWYFCPDGRGIEVDPGRAPKPEGDSDQAVKHRNRTATRRTMSP